MECKWSAFDLDKFYEEDEKLRRDDVRALMDWVDQQPHLPEIDDHIAIIFLHACHYSNEYAKQTLDKFYTVKSVYADIFLSRNPSISPLKEHIEYQFQMILPKKTPQGHCVFFSKLLDSSPDAFDQIQYGRTSDMAGWASFMKNGPNEGLILVHDFTGWAFSHVTKISPMVARKQIHFLQECCAIRLHSIHMINTSPVAAAIMGIVKPFFNKTVQSMLHFHESVEGLLDYVPKQCLPKDYGGELDDIKTLHGQMKEEILEFAPFFEREDKKRVEESLRPEAMRSGVDIFGTAGTFKKLELD